MPNGGVPINMVLRPADGELVLHCRGGELAIYRRDVWDSGRGGAVPLARLTRREAGALAAFIREWVGEVPLEYRRAAGLDVEYDF
jgi:hypothetical protein